MFKVYKFKVNNNIKKLVNTFFDNEVDILRYIMGISRDGYAKMLNSHVDVDGFIDDFTMETMYLDKPIFKTDQISRDSIIIVCSTVRTLTAVNILKKKGFRYVIDYPTLFKYKNDNKLKLRIIENFSQDFNKNITKYNDIYLLLKDNLSKEIFSNLVNYRLNCEHKFLRDFTFDPKGQYFEDFLNLKKNEVFADVGGYDGQTSIEFIKHCPNYKSIYLFEPSQENLLMAKENLKSYKNINFIPKGLSNKKEILRFDASSGSASSISKDGTVQIKVASLDELVGEKITFIKMDIEGAEGLAIEGMTRHILSDYPKLAISVYHRVDDFWKIPQQILAIRDDYDIYVRHYTEGTDETVMFFIPK